MNFSKFLEFMSAVLLFKECFHNDDTISLLLKTRSGVERVLPDILAGCEPEFRMLAYLLWQYSSGTLSFSIIDFHINEAQKSIFDLYFSSPCRFSYSLKTLFNIVAKAFALRGLMTILLLSSTLTSSWPE